MMSLFSSFDTYFSFFCLSSFIFFSILIFSGSQKLSIFSNLILQMKSLMSFFLSLKPKMFNKFSLFSIISCMVSIMIINFTSVFPFSFPLTSDFGSIFIFGFSLWLSFIMFLSVKNIKGILTHCVPEGAPIFLSFILFVIELISNVIRPITLSVRLVANILAGHLLMILLSKLVFIKSVMFSLYILLNLVELFVALIQSYIFCVMISLYFSEVH